MFPLSIILIVATAGVIWYSEEEFGNRSNFGLIGRVLLIMKGLKVFLSSVFPPLGRVRFGLLTLLLGVLIFGGVGEVRGQIAQRGTATRGVTPNTGNNFSTLSIPVPAGVVSGDVLIANLVQNETDNDNGGLSNATAAGWTVISGGIFRSEGTSNGNNAWHGTILYRIANGTEGANITFNLPNSRADMALGSIMAFSGVDVSGGFNATGTPNSGPFDVSPGNLNLQIDSDNDISTGSGITTVTPDAAVIMLAQTTDDITFNHGTSTNPWRTNDGNINEILDENTSNGDDASIGAAWYIKATPGNTGPGQVRISADERRASILLALRPLPPPYRSEFISADLGTGPWCPGETRNVSVTIRNSGTEPWTDSSPDINIGVKWNTNGTSWADYYVRTNAGNLAPGDTRTYTLPLTASNFVQGTGYTTDLASGNNAITFDVVYEGVCWFGNNNGACGPGNSTYTIAQTIAQPAQINDMSQIACSGTGFSVTPLNGTNGTIPAGTTYSWTAPTAPDGFVTGGVAGSGTSITGTLVNTSNIARPVVYTVTPITNGCPGDPFQVNILLNPTAAVTPITREGCSDDSFTVTPVNGTNGIVPASTTYTWTAPDYPGGL